MKRIAALALAAVLLLSSGCTALFDTEAEDAADTISNYAALRRAILRLVTERAESALLQFQNYDGNISRDISTACWEVKSSTALGAFAVDYISYDLSRIVSYTQAEVHITYKRSEYQMSALERLQNLTALRARLEDAVRAGETYLVLELTAAALTSDTIRQIIERAYYADPLACPVLPSVEAAFYPDAGVSRIIEVTFDYGLDSMTLDERRDALARAVDALLAAAFPEETEEPADEAFSDGTDAPEEEAGMVRTLCSLLARDCVSGEEAGSTAWDALVMHEADSEGMAMALEAACRALGIDSRIVSGRLDGESHTWMMVRIGGLYYHVDVSRWDAGEEQVFLVGDEDLWGAYWWDTNEYPACPARFGAEEEASEEPEAPSGEALPGAAAETPEG